MIAGEVVRLKRDGLLQGAFPDLERLIRKAIDEIIKVDPRRHASWPEPIVTRGNPEEKDFLPGDVNQLG